jgi:hypothetical protein
MKRFAKRLLAAAALAAIADGSANASLIGETILATGDVIGGSATIGDGIEFKSAYVSGNIYKGFFNFDFGADTLSITPIGQMNTYLGPAQDTVFSGFTDTITSLSVLSNDGFSGTILNSRFTADSIVLDLSQVGVGSSLVFKIGTSGGNDVPEPASVALSVLGLGGLAAVRRKRKPQVA